MNKILSLFILITMFSAPTFADWSPWNYLGGSIIGDPAACSSGNVSYVVVKGTDNAIWYRKKIFNNPIWEDWRRIPGGLTFTGSPTATCRISNGRVIFDVFAIVNYRNVFRNRLTGTTTFAGWTPVSTEGIPVPLAIESGLDTPRALSSERPHLFARGSDNKIYYSRCLRNMPCDESWSPFINNAISDPASVFRSYNRLDVIVQNSVGRLVHKNIRFGVAYDYGVIPGGPVGSAPDVVSRNSSSLDLFVRGLGGNLMHKRWISGTWGPWNDLGGIATSGPGATAFSNRIMVFVRGTDGALWYRTWTPGF